ncbi:methionyl-tRNA synthetase [Ceratocystis pirilliformis]|uniref:methionine--tRNA ligase n=1 Tax=Ceratocystis pirilliformis TaxID=259994 RepID=A0ABR3ZLK7_9PEZI
MRFKSTVMASDASSPPPEAPKPKPCYVTTPIFYVNASPHIGHMSTMVLADVYKRWRELCGQSAVLSTGTDEHGIKVQQAAARAGIPVKEFCDMNSAKFQDLAKMVGLSKHQWIRTTDADHADAVQFFWDQLQSAGYIYEAKHSGWYAVSDECFYPENATEQRFQPTTGRVVRVASETGNEVEFIEEKNYHFRMTALKTQLLEFYAQSPNWIEPQGRMRDVVNWVTYNLSDLSISRPSSRLSWGIPVPGDDSQTIYVWVDALINYLTQAGYPKALTSDGTLPADSIWPADLHVIGKDIVRFHGVYWPALLLALQLPLPKRILSHAHWTMDNAKISKSAGNAVSANFAVDRFGLDCMRYIMIRDGGIENDAKYSNETIAAHYRADLQGTYGNLLARLTRTVSWCVADAVKANKGATTTQLPIPEAVQKYTQAMESFRPAAACKAIMALLYTGNRYVSEMQPWNKVHSQEKKDNIVYQTAELVRVASILLLPIIPQKAGEALDVLDVRRDRRTMEFAAFGVDGDYGMGPVERTKSMSTTLFPPVLLAQEAY